MKHWIYGIFCLLVAIIAIGPELRATSNAHPQKAVVESQVKEKPTQEKNNRDLVIDGHFLLKNGIPAGPRVGLLLEEIKKAVLEGVISNNKAAITEFISLNH